MADGVLLLPYIDLLDRFERDSVHRQEMISQGYDVDMVRELQRLADIPTKNEEEKAKYNKRLRDRNRIFPPRAHVTYRNKEGGSGTVPVSKHVAYKRYAEEARDNFSSEQKGWGKAPSSSSSFSAAGDRWQGKGPWKGKAWNSNTWWSSSSSSWWKSSQW